jgi:hypothetical protein
MPEVCVSRWRMVIGRHFSGQSGRYLQIESSTLSLPRSCNIMTAIAVNCLVREPMRNLVCGVLGTSCSTLARP